MRNEPAAFGTDLYQVLAGEAGDLVFSPSSVAGALRMAWYGARGITAAGPLLISTVAHQAYTDVNEQGTEAAAATAVVMGRSAVFRAPPSVTMVVDRPFLFAILDSATGVTVFLGQVSQPRSA
ncbi:MAG TPA: serpin family protein [Streptosporangiaceae bacterium]|nr:serpin family protein [Streptosporangiaceae bacterium]